MAASRVPNEIWTKIVSLVSPPERNRDSEDSMLPEILEGRDGLETQPNELMSLMRVSKKFQSIGSPLFLAHVRLLHPGASLKFQETLARWHRDLGSRSPALNVRSLSYDLLDGVGYEGQDISRESEQRFISILRFLPNVNSIHFVGGFEGPSSVLVALAARNRPLASLTGVFVGSSNFPSLVALLLSPAGSSMRHLGIGEGPYFESYTSTDPPTPPPFTHRTPYPSLQTLSFSSPPRPSWSSLPQELFEGWSFTNLQQLRFKGIWRGASVPPLEHLPSTIRFLWSATLDDDRRRTLLAHLELEELTLALDTTASFFARHARLDLIREASTHPQRSSVRSLILLQMGRLHEVETELLQTPDIFIHHILPKFPSLKRIVWVTQKNDSLLSSVEWIQFFLKLQRDGIEVEVV